MTMKTPLALAVAALLLVGTTACNRGADAGANDAANDTAADATMTDPADTNADASMPPADMAAPSQAEALALLNAVNDHEVKSAQMAKSKNVTGPVLEYANMMQAEHTANMTQTTALLDTHGGVPTDSDKLAGQKAKAEAKRAQLDGLQGDAFAKGYIDAMVTDHAEALGMLDSMLPAATDDAVRAHLTTTRQHVQQHHDRAREIQSQLGGAAGASPAAQGGTGR